MQKDLTKGNVLKTLFFFALPMVLTSLLQSVYSIVDMMIVGKNVGGTGVSGVNNASLMMNLMTQIAIGFTVGGNVLIGRYFGQNKKEISQKTAATLLIFSLSLGLVSGLFFHFFAEEIMKFIDAPALTEATVYFRISALGMCFIFGYNALSAIFRGYGNSKVTLYFIACSATTNIFLDLLLVSPFGVEGAALATVISQGISFLLALTYLLKHREEYGFGKETFAFYPERAKEIFQVGFPMVLQWSIASISWLVVAFLVNQYGEDVSAGNGISNKIKEFCQLFIAAFTGATGTMIAQNLGAKEIERAREVLKSCLKITLSVAVILITFVQLTAPFLVSFFIDEGEVALSAVTNLRIEILAQIFYAGFMSFHALAVAAKHTYFVMGNSFLNCIIVRLFLALVLESSMGITGVYLACMIAPSVSVPVGYWYYKSEKWIPKENQS
ncbi:MAG: MATE family efflux transporter [Eubacteriales bacterium]